ncbi:MAG: hypothetical protein M1828_002719 [Chrysothrix sp. TS-e1954]|nr:MAG: hypothetical protein M1828_002719 [Chrysothrix sp. TS-e1954]
MSTSDLVACGVNRTSELSLTNETLVKNPRKRKRSGEHGGDGKIHVALSPFSIQNDTHRSDVLLCAKPLIILSRARLPLSFLATRAVACHRHVPRFLKLENQAVAQALDFGGPQRDSKILIVNFDDEKPLYALECVARGTYAVCPLDEAVNIQDLRAIASDIKPEHVRSSAILPKHNSATDWWSQCAVPLGLNHANGKAAEPDCGPERSAAGRDSQQTSIPEQTDAQPVANEFAPLELSSPPEEVHENLVRQYLDTLYLSRSSLAYFSKGPLSRARAASSHYRSQDHGVSGLHGFIENLRAMLLKPSTIDKKYVARLPEVIKKYVQQISSEQAHGAVVARGRVSRKPKKLKLKKGGLYAPEEDLVLRWWLQEDEGSLCEVHDTASGSRIVQLKTREIYMQLLLLVEIAAAHYDLDATRKCAPTDGQIPDVSRSIEAVDDCVFDKRKESARDEMQLDMLVDRLCIWQSVNAGNASQKRSREATPSDMSRHEGGPRGSKGKDELKDLCTDVIIPLYASRVPKVVRRIALKVGIAIEISDSRATPVTSFASKVAPGTEIKRPRPSKIKSAHRTQDNNDRSAKDKPPSLLRSVTDSHVQGIKRGQSASPRDASMFTDARRSLSRSNSIVQSRQIAQREVNMDAIAKYNDSRGKKKVESEHELKAAIAALKKPNRSLAVKDYAEAVDSSRTSTSNRPTKSVSNALRRNLLPVEVNATPKRNKLSKHGIVLTPRKDTGSALNTRESPIPSTMPLIPSSSIKAKAQAFHHETSTPMKSAMSTTSLFQTPSQGKRTSSTLFRSAESSGNQVAAPRPLATKSTSSRAEPVSQSCSPAPFIPSSSPVHHATSSRIPLAPKSANSTITPATSKHRDGDLLEVTVTHAPSKDSVESGEEADASIYESLGWHYDLV